MSQQFLSGLTASVLATVAGTTLALSGEMTQTAAQNLAENSTNLGRIEASQIAEEANRVAQVYPHQWREYPAATLYVRGIPVLTFLDPSPAGQRRKTGDRPANQFISPAPQATPLNLSETKQTSSTGEGQTKYDPLWRATTVAARLNYLSENNIDASQITVDWSDRYNAYLISVGDEPLVTIDRRTILPDTTRNASQDALQATNRLRRLLGNAPPLELREVARAPQTPELVGVRVISQQQGMASWYGPGFHGRRSASGERFNQNAMTAAHRTLPFGTRVRVTNLNNGRSVTVRINDRGPFIRGRIIDLSIGAARKINMVNSGVAPVRVEVLGQ